MKKLIIGLSLLTIFGCIALSCHKTKHTAAVPVVVSSPISGITAVRHMTYVDTGSSNFTTQITWNFSGTGPVIAAPGADTAYLGHELVSFTGSNVTQISYYNSGAHTGEYGPLTTNISYTAANLPDTITFVEPYAWLGQKKLVFQYAGDHITEIIAASTDNTTDTFHWSTADFYYFTYTGSNISQMIISRWPGTTGTVRDSETHNYVTGSRINNFGGSLPTFLSLYFPLASTAGLDEFLYYFPYYMNANIIESDNGGAITTITDTAGRITERVMYSVTSSDTTLYYY